MALVKPILLGLLCNWLTYRSKRNLVFWPLKGFFCLHGHWTMPPALSHFSEGSKFKRTKVSHKSLPISFYTLDLIIWFAKKNRIIFQTQFSFKYIIPWLFSFGKGQIVSICFKLWTFVCIMGLNVHHSLPMSGRVSSVPILGSEFWRQPEPMHNILLL